MLIYKKKRRVFVCGVLLALGVAWSIVRCCISLEVATDYELLTAQQNLLLALENNAELQRKYDALRALVDKIAEEASQAGAEFLELASGFLDGHLKTE